MGAADLGGEGHRPHTPNAASPDLIAIEDTATTGARGCATDARTAVATVRFGRIDITPGSACLPPDSTLQMSAGCRGCRISRSPGVPTRA